MKDVAAVAVSNPDMEESAGDEEVKVVVVLEDGRRPSIRPSSIEYLRPGCRATGCRASSSTSRSFRARSRSRCKKADLREAGVTAGTWDQREGRRQLKREVLT